jgi:hypothetical protein
MIFIASYDILNTAYLESIKNAPSKRYCENRLQLKVNKAVVLNLFEAATPLNLEFLFATHKIF